jgi:integrase
MDQHAATRRLRHLAEAAGIQIARAHPHMLRHTYVTTMQVSGVASAASFGGLRERRGPGLRGQRGAVGSGGRAGRHAG